MFVRDVIESPARRDVAGLRRGRLEETRQLRRRRDICSRDRTGRHVDDGNTAHAGRLSADVESCRAPQSPPTGNAIHLEHEHFTIHGRDQIHARIVRTDHCCGAHGELLPGSWQLEWPHRTAARHVAAPLACGRQPLDRTEHPATDDKGTDVAAAVVDGALHVEDRAHLLERPHDTQRHLGIADPHHPVSQRPEERLDDRVAHGAHRRQSVRSPFAHDRLGSRQACLLQQGRRVELVDRAFDGARRVDNRYAALFNPV